MKLLKTLTAVTIVCIFIAGCQFSMLTPMARTNPNDPSYDPGADPDDPAGESLYHRRGSLGRAEALLVTCQINSIQHQDRR